MRERGPVLVVAPLKEELAAFLRRIARPQRERVRGRAVVKGTVAGVEVVAAVTGDGAGRSGDALAALLGPVGPSALLGLGVAGGLDPALPWGTVLASREVIAVGRTDFPADPTWLARSVAAGLRTGSFAVSPRLVASPQAKAALRRALGDRPACVDLESAAYAEAATSEGIPFVVVRAVVDEAGEPVAPGILRAEHADGHVARARVVAGAMRRPSEIGALLAIAARVRACAGHLADAAEALLAAASPPPG